MLSPCGSQFIVNNFIIPIGFEEGICRRSPAKNAFVALKTTRPSCLKVDLRATRTLLTGLNILNSWSWILSPSLLRQPRFHMMPHSQSSLVWPKRIPEDFCCTSCIPDNLLIWDNSKNDEEPPQRRPWLTHGPASRDHGGYLGTSAAYSGPLVLNPKYYLKAWDNP